MYKAFSHANTIGRREVIIMAKNKNNQYSDQKKKGTQTTDTKNNQQNMQDNQNMKDGQNCR